MKFARRHFFSCPAATSPIVWARGKLRTDTNLYVLFWNAVVEVGTL
jgi:hypothetical protein